MIFPRFFSRRILLIRGVALAAAGSGLAWRFVSSYYNVSVSVNSPTWESLIRPWKLMNERNTFFHCSNSHGVFPHPLSMMSNVPNSPTAAGTVTEGAYPNHHCNCLGRDTIANVAEKLGPAVVHLSVLNGLFGRSLSKDIGSGTIIDEDGTILTCAHIVVEPQSRKLSSNVDITLHDGRSFEGMVVHANLDYDVAVVKIKSKTPLPFAKLGCSSTLRPGDWVVAMGCPFSLQNTITAGIISFVGRKSTDLGMVGVQRDFLQIDCAINKGNSGGPLVNIDGEVVGINLTKFLGSTGISFALPIDYALKIMEHFKRHGRVVRPWLGMTMIDLNDKLIEQLIERHSSFPDVSSGVLVTMVFPGSPSERAGFLQGDVVIEFGGKSVESFNQVMEIMDDKVGIAFKVVVKRGNNMNHILTVTPTM